MNIDAILEDLEAQGYFASTTKNEQQETKLLCKSVFVVRENVSDVALAMPLLGKDFIAGFLNRVTKSTWLLIRDYSYLNPQDQGTVLQETELTLKSVTQAHLIGVSLRLSLGVGSPELSGYITRIFSKMIEFVSFEAKVHWIPIAQVKYVAVDKISIKPQV
jgi:hypothetical protein